MSSKEIVTAAAEPEFYQRVAFIALRVAHAKAMASDSDEDTIGYANRVLAGSDNILMLAMHIAATSHAIAEKLEQGAPGDITDGRIEAAIENVWQSRARAFRPVALPAVPGAGDQLDDSNVPPRADHDNPPAPPPLPPPLMPEADINLGILPIPDRLMPQDEPEK
jgi:hypothetical protein